MKEPDLHPTLAYQADAQLVVPTFPPIPANANLETGRRLIVLISEDIDYSAARRRIWELARATGMHIQLLGLCKDTTEESRLRRELITLACLLQDGKTTAKAQVDIGTSWLNAVKANYETGDVIVCFAEQRTGLLQRPLSQILESNFKSTVYILSDLALQQPKPGRLAQLGAWLGSIGIIIAFGILQAKIVQYPEGWLQNILIILSVIPEFWLIWLWGGRFNTSP